MRPSISPGLLNLGIVAHVDAGKTTLTEQMLVHGGQLRRAGSVDRGTATTDFLDVERERGISVRAAATALEWKGLRIQLIDTPGHGDFAGEVERSLRVLDGAILIVSAVEGVQAHTELLWKALSELNIPTLLFLNKLDRVGANPEGVLADLRRRLNRQIVAIQEDEGALLEGERVYEALCEALGEHDEALLEDWFSGVRVTETRLWAALRAQTAKRQVFPLVRGAALHDRGVETLMDAVALLLPRATQRVDAPASGLVFQVEHDKQMGRVAHVRLFEGQLNNRDSLRNQTRGLDEKITQIRSIRAERREDSGHIAAGEIAALYGLSQTRVGDVLGSGHAVPPLCSLAKPLLQVHIQPSDEAEYPGLVAAMEQLSAEDPLLELSWEPAQRQLYIHITGLIQLEVLSRTLATRFGLNVRFGQPVVLYQETPLQAATGFVAYTMPKPCWAVFELWIEPLPLGSGLVLENRVKDPNAFLPRYQSHVLQTIPKALRQGMHGWPVTDLRVTLVDGNSHKFHTHPLDFIAATPMAVMDGLQRAGTGLLEPMWAFRIVAPEECATKLLGELVQMRGAWSETRIDDGRFYCEGRYPVATSMDFPMRLAALTNGRATLSQRFDGYQPCALEQGASTPYRGVNPLDTAKYILYIRNALGNERVE